MVLTVVPGLVDVGTMRDELTDQGEGVVMDGHQQRGGTWGWIRDTALAHILALTMAYIIDLYVNMETGLQQITEYVDKRMIVSEVLE